MSDIVTADSLPGANYLDKLQKLKDLKKELAVKHERRLDLARHDYRYFAEYCLKDESTGGGVTLAEIHKKWIEHIYYSWTNGLHAFILAPYGHGKTSNIAVGIPLFLLGNNPNLRIIIVSSNDSIARERLVLIRQYIDHSEEYHELFPHVKADTDMGWTKGELYLKRSTYAKDPSLSARGATSSGIGKRADIIILDDINDAKNTLHQPKMREVIWGNFTGVYLSRLEPGGKVLGIMTRWHEKDLVGQILENEEMRASYAFLIQRINETFDAVECETIIPAHPKASPVIHEGEIHNLFKLYDNGVI